MARTRLTQGKQAPADWAAHFRALSMTTPTASFGTVFGSYTIGELIDLLKAKDDEFSILDKDSATYLPQWQKSAPQAAQAWQADYAKLKADYGAARSIAQAAIDKAHAGAWTNVVPDLANTSGDQPYKLVLQALNPQWQGHSQASSRVFQLRQRLSTAGATMSEYHVRQPTAADFDTGFLKVTQPIVEGVDTAFRAAKKPIESAWDTARIMTFAVIGGVVLIALSLIKNLSPVAGSVAKAYLPPPPKES